MRFAQYLRRLADRVDPPQAPILSPDVKMEDPPPGSTVILDVTNHAQIIGHPDAHFMRRERHYMDNDGKKCKVTIKNNLHASGCGHSLTSPEDIGFLSYISRQPVCKICEREYKRMRNETRHELCKCRHLVAPHELTYIEGKGFACEECEKKIKALNPLKAIGWLLGLFLKPLITINEENPAEVTHETLQLPSPPGNQPPVQYHSQARPRYRTPDPTAHEVGRPRSRRPHHYQ